MATIGTPPFRADHIGSLLRPVELRRAFRMHATGEMSDEEFSQAQDAAIAAVVVLQHNVGLRVATDGEFRRGSYWSSFVSKVHGLSVMDAQFKFRDNHGAEIAFTAPYAHARVSRDEPIAVDEFIALRAATSPLGLTGKVTIPAPSSMHFWRNRDFADQAVYSEPVEFFEDLAEIYKAEIQDLASIGCTYVQLDEVALAMLCDCSIRDELKDRGGDPVQLADMYISAINAAVDERPAGMRIGLHLCRGNFKGQHLAAGGYGPVAEALFERANVDHFLLEFDTERSGDFEPLRHVPESKGVVLGLVCSKSPEVETEAAIIERVKIAEQYIDLERLAISPQCGFASTAAGNPVTEEVQKDKLERVVEAAQALWG